MVLPAASTVHPSNRYSSHSCLRAMKCLLVLLLICGGLKAGTVSSRSFSSFSSRSFSSGAATRAAISSARAPASVTASLASGPVKPITGTRPPVETINPKGYPNTYRAPSTFSAIRSPAIAERMDSRPLSITDYDHPFNYMVNPMNPMNMFFPWSPWHHFWVPASHDVWRAPSFGNPSPSPESDDTEEFPAWAIVTIVVIVLIIAVAACRILTA